MTTQLIDDDASDLTDREVTEATPMASTGALIDQLKEKKCSECGGSVRITSHALRRRKPSIYWRVGITCPSNHVTTVTFKALWLLALAET